MVISNAQLNTTPNFKNIDDSYLNVKNIGTHCFDKNGRFWMTTSEGLACYNGYTTEIFSSLDNNGNTILNDTIISLFISSKNQIWISYITEKGISKYDIETKTFYHYLTDSLEENNTLPPLLTSNIFEDSKGRIWLPTWGSGLFLLDDQTGKYTKKYSVETHPDFFKSNYSRYINEISDDIFIIGFFEEKKHPTPIILNFKNDELIELDLDEFSNNLGHEQVKFLKLGLSIIHFCHQDKNNDLWIGTYIGLFYLDMKNKIFKRISDPSSDLTQGNIDNCLNFKEDNEGNLWIITPNKGLLFVNTQLKQGKYIVYQSNNQNSLNDNRLKGISKDNKGNIIMSSRLGCLSIYNPYSHQFKIHSWNKMNLNYFNASIQVIPVNQMLVLDNGIILLSNANGLSFYDSKKREEITNLSYNNLLNYRPTEKKNIGDFKLIGNDLYGETGLRIFKFNMVTKKVNIIDQKKGFNHILFKHDKDVDSIYTVWNTKDESFLYRLNGTTNKFELKDTLHDSLMINAKFSHLLDNGKWFLQKNEKYFQLFDFKTKEHKIFSHKNKNSYFPDSTIICSFKDKNSMVYIGTKKGLYLFDGNNYSYEKLNEKIGKDISNVNSIFKDLNGNIWLALEKELVKWDEKNNKTFVFDRNLGLQSGSFLPSVMQTDDENKLYMATNNGILEFDPDKIEFPIEKPEIYLYSFVINDDTLSDDKLKDFVESEIILEWNQNNLNLSFYSNEIFSPTPPNFYYKIEGVHNEWQENGSLNSIKLNGLKHGDYSLQIKMINSYQIESDVYNIHFTIKKPFWLSVWFYVISILILIILIYIFIKKREAKLVQNQKKLEKIVQDRTSELENEKLLLEKQKEITEQQKELVEEKNKEIIDSINYAKRIQNAILPSNDLIKENLPDSFVLYKPKDIVAGDFYWLEITENKILLAAADCTGHGVPGAMVSVVCNNALNRSVREYNLTKPSDILNQTREIVINEFEKSGEDVKDGMDISLISIAYSPDSNRGRSRSHTHSVNWSGANNPLWIVKKDSKEIIEIKPNKQPIGKYDKLLPFDNHELELENGDTIYLFTDGYQDQFGGEKGKKLKATNLKNLVLSIADKTMKEQSLILDEFFENWRNNLEQVDDVCIIGVRLH